MEVNIEIPALEKCPINPDWMVRGDCEAFARCMDTATDSASYYWRVIPGMHGAKFKWRYDTDEIVHIISGRPAIMLLTPPNDNLSSYIHHLGPGSVHRFKKGEVWLWSVSEPVTKFAVFVFTRSALRRMLSRLKRKLMSERMQFT